MFQVELLSGGVFIVYAVDTKASMFLIYRDGYWAWIDVTECKPHTPPWMGIPYAGSTAQACGRR